MPGRTKEELARLFRANLASDPAAAVRSARLCGMTDTELLDELAKVPRQAARPGQEPEERSLVVVRGSDAKREHLKFLWEPWLPLGKLVHMGGNSSQGKSPVAVDLLTRLSTGRDWPNEGVNPHGPMDCILLNIEDSLEDTIMPRFDLAEGDDARLHYVKGTRLSKGAKSVDRSFALDADMALLAELARSLPDLAMIVIDPVTNYLGAASMNKEDEVRRVLTPLAALAEELGICVVTIGHFNRREKGTDPLHRMMGAAAFSGVARAVYAFGPDPDSESPYAHVISPARGALGDMSLKYKTELVEREWAGERSKVVRVVWDGSSSATAEDAVDPASRQDKTLSVQAAKVLRDFLKSGRKPMKDCEQALKDAGFDPDKMNLLRVRKAAKIASEQRDRQWWWFLPSGGESLF